MHIINNYDDSVRVIVSEGDDCIQDIRLDRSESRGDIEIGEIHYIDAGQGKGSVSFSMLEVSVYRLGEDNPVEKQTLGYGQRVTVTIEKGESGPIIFQRGELFLGT
jgi:hypothetical protein